MSEKMIVCVLKNGETWGVPLKFIAANRAKYYLDNKPDDVHFNEEIKFIMEDDYEGIDWFRNNMNPDELEAHFRMILPAPEPDSFNDKFDEMQEIRIEDVDV